MNKAYRHPKCFMSISDKAKRPVCTAYYSVNVGIPGETTGDINPRYLAHVTVPISQIEQVQRRAACSTVSNFDRQASVTQIVQDLRWPTLKQRRFCLFYKLIHGSVAVSIPVYIQYNNRISGTVTPWPSGRSPLQGTIINIPFPPWHSTVECPAPVCCMLAEL